MLKKIGVRQLRLGMHIHELCGSWIDHPFWRTRFVLTDPDDIRLIADSGIEEAWIDDEKGLDVAAAGEVGVHEAAGGAAPTAAAPSAGAPPKRVALGEEIERAKKICATAKTAVFSMFQEVRMGQAISSEVASELVHEISSSVKRNPGALISLARLKTADDYTYLHSVAVCALMVALAGKLGLDEAQTRAAGMGGLLHDMGKAMIPIAVLNKPGKLSDDEFRVVRAHPEEGHRLLVAGGVADGAALDVVLHHQEKLDGSGYPHGLKGEQIGILARMAAVCDVYDAITSNRPYKAGWDPAESIARMAEWSGSHLDPGIFQAFVKSIGIYPVGSLVRLSSGRLGVIVEQSEKSLLAPRIKVFFSSTSMTYIPPETISVGRPGVTEKIVSREDARKWGIRNLQQLWMA